METLTPGPASRTLRIRSVAYVGQLSRRLRHCLLTRHLADCPSAPLSGTFVCHDSELVSAVRRPVPPAPFQVGR